MNERDDLYGILSDQLIYNQLYAPDYPEEDQTSPEAEFAKIMDIPRRVNIGPLWGP